MQRRMGGGSAARLREIDSSTSCRLQLPCCVSIAQQADMSVQQTSWHGEPCCGTQQAQQAKEGA